MTSHGTARPAPTLELTELVGAALMHGDDAWNQMQLEAVDSAVDDIDAILLRDIEGQAHATAGCRSRRPPQAADIVFLERPKEELAEHLRGHVVQVDPLNVKPF